MFGKRISRLKCLCILSMGMTLHVLAAELIILKDNSSIWAASVRKEGDQLVFVRDGGGDEERLEQNSVDMVISAVVRGRNYSAAEITSALDAIEQVSRRRGKLRKQLNMLRGEWSGLQKDTSGLEQEIGELLNRFARNPADTALFKDVKISIGMIQFKDMRGIYKEQINSALARIQKEYCATNMERLAGYTNVTTASVAQFVAARQIADDVAAAKPPAADLARVNEMIEKCWTNAWKYNGSRAWDSFQNAKTMQAYLDSARTLFDLKQHMAGNDQQKSVIDDLQNKMRAALAKSSPDYSLEMKGVPLNGADRDVLNRLRRRLTLITLASIPFEEHSFIFPTTTPAGASMRSVIHVPVRIIFARTPPPGRTYCLQAMILGNSGGAVVRRTKPLNLVLKDGHMDAGATFDFTTMERDFSPQRQRDGQACVLVLLVFNDKPERAGAESIWTAASVAFPIPVL